MYILNLDSLSLSEDKIYKCNEFIANRLIYDCGIPLLGQTKDGEFCFARTEEFEKRISEVPFYYRWLMKL